MNRKAGTPIAIGILTFGIIVLMFFALFTFLTKQNQYSSQLQSPDILNSVYAREAEINFQISQLMEESLNDLDRPITKTTYLESFKENFQTRQLATLFPEFKELKSQFVEQNLEIQEEETITLTLNIKIDKTGKLKEREVAYVRYIYEKDFTTRIP